MFCRTLNLSVLNKIGSVQRNKECTENIGASIIAKLLGSGIANSVISSVVGDLELASGLHSQVKQQILFAVPKDNIIRVTLGKNNLESFENPFVNFNTESKRLNYFNTKWGVVEPVDIVLGIQFDARRNKQEGSYVPVPVNDTFVYIPILESIKFMCQNPDICKLMGELLYHNLIDTKTFVMEVIVRHIHCSLNTRILYKSSCSMISLKLLTHWVQNEVFTK